MRALAPLSVLISVEIQNQPINQPTNQPTNHATQRNPTQPNQPIILQIPKLLQSLATPENIPLNKD